MSVEGVQDLGMQPFVESVYSRANCLHPQAFFVRLDSRCNQKCASAISWGPMSSSA